GSSGCRFLRCSSTSRNPAGVAASATVVADTPPSRAASHRSRSVERTMNRCASIIEQRLHSFLFVVLVCAYPKLVFPIVGVAVTEPAQQQPSARVPEYGVHADVPGNQNAPSQPTNNAHTGDQ